MIRVEWALMMTAGPVVGSALCRGPEAACDALERALRGAAGISAGMRGGGWTPAHAEAAARIRQAVMRESGPPLDRVGRWRYETAGVSIALTREP
ncbi:hypothetical protein [Streptomyces roseoverticillatus]|uniref:Uncharacterized protein n=1 Tax=Streptomyces roseoverticillatus TaxID=66429 RepID=A0ABV3J5V2_9ACTN